MVIDKGETPMKMRKLDQILEQCIEEMDLQESKLDLDKLDKLFEDAYDNYEDEHFVDLDDPEEKLLSDEQIADQYNNFKCTYIKIEPSRAGYDNWFNATLELEFPDADHPDFNDSCIENLYYNREDDRWGFDGMGA